MPRRRDPEPDRPGVDDGRTAARSSTATGSSTQRNGAHVRPARGQLEQLRVRLRPGLGDVVARHHRRPRRRTTTRRRRSPTWGANTVRLPLNQDCWLGTRGAPVSDQFEERTPSDYRSSVARLRDRAQPAGHGRDPRPAQPQADRPARVRQRRDARLRVTGLLALGRRASTRDNPSVMFDAFNEPYSRYNADRHTLVFDLTWKCWRDGGCQAPVEDDQTATEGRVTYTVQGMAAVVARDPRRRRRRSRSCSAASTTPTTCPTGSSSRPTTTSWWRRSTATTSRSAPTEKCWDSVLAPIADRVPVLTGELGATDPIDGYVEPLPRLGRRPRASARSSGSGPTTRTTRWRWSATRPAPRRRTALLARRYLRQRATA